ncbi:MAG TPA: M1 family aminopeptidase, partial [Gemmatimonadaceae bacterium]
PERKIIGADSALFASSVSDPSVRGFACFWLRQTPFGSFIYSIDPRSDEPLTLGQFVRIDPKDRRSAARQLRKQQRRGRQLGLTVDDLGTWDTWVSQALPCTADCAAAPFEASTYKLDVTIDRSLHLQGKANVVAKTIAASARVINMQMLRDLQVQSVLDASGAPLQFVRADNQLSIALPQSVARGTDVSVRVEYSGDVFEKRNKSIVQIDPLAWYPHVGSLDRATYDVTFRWPRDLELLAGGHRTEGGETADARWEHRVLNLPSAGFTFEIGHFTTRQLQAGHVAVTLAFDPSEDLSALYRSLSNDRWRNNSFAVQEKGLSPKAQQEIADHVVGAIRFAEEMYGPYALDEMTVLNVSRSYSQAMLGFVTLSTEMMVDVHTDDLMDVLSAGEDRRTVIAHEIAHQWWGHVLGWKSYRDQWISEGMASWTALQYAKTLDWTNRLRIGPTTGWQVLLGSRTSDGRTVEELGPIVLGQRLNSSRSDGAYELLIYKKAPLLLDMLAHEVGESTFKKRLAALFTTKRNTALTTSEFLSAGAGGSKQSASSLFYSTGVPLVTYRYGVDASGGKYSLHITGTQELPQRTTYAVVKQPDGKTAMRIVSKPATGAQWQGSVPVQVAPAGAAPGTVARNRMQLPADRIDTRLDLPFQPDTFTFDPDGEVLVYFYDEQHDAKRAMLHRGLSLLASGKSLEAVTTLRGAADAKAMTTTFGLGFEIGGSLRKIVTDYETRYLDSAIQLALSRALLEQRDAPGAREALKRARRLLDRDMNTWIDGDATVIESRADLVAGDFSSAYARLAPYLAGTEKNDTPEALAAFAVAVVGGHRESELPGVLERCRRHGVDVSPLE